MIERQFKNPDDTHTSEEMRGITGDASDTFTRIDIPIQPIEHTDPASMTIYTGKQIRAQMANLLDQISDHDESCTLGGSPGESTEPGIS